MTPRRRRLHPKPPPVVVRVRRLKPHAVVRPAPRRRRQVVRQDLSALILYGQA